jgi:hypothetical protein
MNMRCGTTGTAHALLEFDALVLASVPMIIGKILSRNVIRPSVGVTPRHQTVR